MGGHYGSIQVRSEDRARILAAAEQVARDKGIHILAAPPANGWMALFPENHGQDDSVGQAVAEQLGGDVLHLLVHDDDIFAYWFWRDRRLIDSYRSKPGYFGEENLAREEAMAGNPELFRPLIGDDVVRLAELLNRDPFVTFESERLREFGELLKIPNAVNAFEYLKEGERTGVKNWRQFVEVPAERVADEAQAARHERNRIAAERKRLKSAGLLLAFDERKEQMPYGCPAGNGFLVAWPDYRKSVVAFNHYREPWDQPAAPELGSPQHSAGLVSDSSARRVAVTAGKRVSVWDLAGEQWSHVCDAPEADHAVGVALSPDGTLLAHASRQEIVITRIESRERLLAWKTTATPRHLAFHPTEAWLAVSGNALGLLAIGEAEPWRDLYVGGKSNAAAVGAALIRDKMKEVNVDEIERAQRVAVDKAIAQLEKPHGRSKKGALTPEQIEAMKRQMQEQLDQFRSRLVALKEGRLPATPPQAREQVRCVGFSRDGRWFWCGTSAGLRVYEWDAVPRKSGADMPAPRWAFELPEPGAFGGQVHAIAEEADAPAIAFAGASAHIYRLDLLTGQTRELMQVAQNASIYALALSPNGALLGTCFHTLPSTERRQRRNEQRGAWAVWDYAKLRGPFLR